MNYYITPVAKPRQTRADKWQQRPRVMRYRAFANEVNRLMIKVRESGDHVTFVMPMPESWSKRKRFEMLGRPHKVKPDVDNLCKSILDSLFKNDSHIHDIRISKVWGELGMIIVEAEQ